MEDQTRNQIGTAAVIGAAVGAASVLAGGILMDSALDSHSTFMQKRMFKPQAEGVPPFDIPDDNLRMIIERNAAQMQKAVAAWKAQTAVECAIRMVDGNATRLAGFLYYNDKPTRRWVVLVHGYRGSHLEMETYAHLYAQQGFNVLAPDLRSHGESDGRYIGMGWTDADDVLGWVDYLIHRFGDDIDIVLHGHSMGAAAVAAASGRCAYPQVSAIVADSCYTSVWDIFVCQMHKQLHVPVHPILDLANLNFQARGGFDFHRASMVDSLRASRIPTLIIHGAADDFVPASMAPPLYAACGASLKELRILPGIGHTMALFADPEGYRDLVKRFLVAVNS